MSNLQKLFNNISELFQQQFKLIKYLNDRIDELEKILVQKGLKNV